MNRSRQVWQRLNQLEENHGEAEQRNLELKYQNGKLQSSIPKILEIMHTHMRQEHYQTPVAPNKYPIIDTKLWNDSLGNVKNEIHHRTQNARKIRDYKHISKQTMDTYQHHIKWRN